MAETDPEVVAALGEQMVAWRSSLDAGAERVGWKIGLNVPDVQRKLGLREPVIGHLTSASRLEDGARFSAAEAADLRVEPEVALHMGAGGSIAAYGPAMEIVDLGNPPSSAASIIAGNVFHRAFVLGPTHAAFPPGGVEGEVRVNGSRREAGNSPGDFSDVVELVSRLLGDVGEELREGDVIIAGSLTAPQPVQAGDEVEVGIGPLGNLSVAIAP